METTKPRRVHQLLDEGLWFVPPESMSAEVLLCLQQQLRGHADTFQPVVDLKATCRQRRPCRLHVWTAYAELWFSFHQLRHYCGALCHRTSLFQDGIFLWLSTCSASALPYFCHIEEPVCEWGCQYCRSRRNFLIMLSLKRLMTTWTSMYRFIL